MGPEPESSGKQRLSGFLQLSPVRFNGAGAGKLRKTMSNTSASKPAKGASMGPEPESSGKLILTWLRQENKWMLQWGRSRKAPENYCDPPYYKCPDYASMGPEPESSGKPEIYWPAGDQPPRFNGAGAGKLRKTRDSSASW